MNLKAWVAVVASSVVVSGRALAVCGFAPEALQKDPVEVGFCESDAVFVAKVEQVVESTRGQTEAGATRTDHFHTQYGTLRVLETLKGTVPAKVTTLADLKVPESAYVFESEKTYLVFAKKLAHEGEYSAAGACSLQPTLPIDKAKKALQQLRQNKSGQRKIECENIRGNLNGSVQSAPHVFAATER